MDAEIVLDQNNGFGMCEVDVGQVFQDVSVIHGGMAIGDLDMAPAFERSKHHEEISGAVALVLVVKTRRASRFHRHRHARLGNEFTLSDLISRIDIDREQGNLSSALRLFVLNHYQAHAA